MESKDSHGVRKDRSAELTEKKTGVNWHPIGRGVELRARSRTCTARLQGERDGDCNHSEAGGEGREFLAGIAAAGGCVYAGGSYRGPEADWSDGRGVGGEGSAAAG